MGKPKVCVLMSTYNGEKYIRDQIESILKQNEVDVQLIIRDDGSSDKTIEIVAEYASHYGVISYDKGINLGVGKSFLSLLNNAPPADYYAFADQDDVWLEDKLSRAVGFIQKAEASDISGACRGYALNIEGLCGLLPTDKKESIPVLYGSNTTLTDENLYIIGDHNGIEVSCGLYENLSRNTMYGCTMVMNRELVDAFKTVPPVSDNVLKRKNHDAWILYFAFINGVVLFDGESRILYRQHNNNVVGGKKLSGIPLFAEKCKRIINKKNKNLRSSLANDLIRCYSSALSSEMRSNLETISQANSIAGIRRLLKNSTITDSFHESKVIILLRGLFNWI